MSKPMSGAGGAPYAGPDDGPPATTVASPHDTLRARPVGLAVSYPAVGPAVIEARTQVTRWLRAAGVDDAMTSDVVLAVSEACTNVVVHAYRGRGADNGDLPRFRIVGESAEGVVKLTVSDYGRGMQPRPDSPGLGLGVSLMASLSDRVVVGSQPDGSGTVVRMSFTAAGSRSRARRMH